jgi:phosphatidylglycerol---prolipoprotein diacylglyceryl transferase
MSKTSPASTAPKATGLRRIAPYWFVIAALLLVMSGIYAYHLATGITPDRAALRIPSLNFDIYWYGIWIVGGIALGCGVAAYLARLRGVAVFEAAVPLTVRQKSVAELDLPDEIGQIVARRGVRTLGELLLPWGFDPRGLGLNQDGVDGVRARLLAHPDVEPQWALNASWRVWNPEHVWNGIIWCLILAVIGARLYHVLTPSPSMAAVGINSPLDYLRNPAQMFNFRSGGLGIYGGLAGGALGLWLYTRRQRISMLAWADLAVIGLALGQFVGRWGNFFNQELYGRPTTAFWAIFIEPQYRLSGYSNFSHFHPAFLYESLWSLLAFLTLHTLFMRFRTRLQTGDLMALYLIFYGIGRSLLELVRLDSRLVTLGELTLPMAVATLVSLLVAVVMALWLLARRWRLGRG